MYTLLANNDAQGVDMRISTLDPDVTDLADVEKRNWSEQEADCVVRWVRGAEQFIANPVSGTCDGNVISFQLGETYLFRNEDFGVRALKPHPANAPYHLARSRPFECYVDYPGASGGADIPFKRHIGIFLHDKGGSADVEVQDGRIF